jgi:hypothetical protein
MSGQPADRQARRSGGSSTLVDDLPARGVHRIGVLDDARQASIAVRAGDHAVVAGCAPVTPGGSERSFGYALRRRN